MGGQLKDERPRKTRGANFEGKMPADKGDVEGIQPYAKTTNDRRPFATQRTKDYLEKRCGR